MKKYKTWEMVKLLSENPDKVFKLEDGLRIYSYKGTISCTNASPIFMEVHIYDEWEEVLKYVTWQEALEAKAVSGRSIRCEITDPDGKINSYIYLGDSFTFMANDGYALDSDSITKGIWYILD